MASQWQRARRPEQKAERRQGLLEAASRLHEARPIEEISLTAIAREAEVSKANVYRYFESREALFLALTLETALEWRDTLLRSLGALSSDTRAEPIAAAFTSSLRAHPRLGRLFAVLASVLERKVSADAIAEFKIALHDELLVLVPALLALKPGWTPAAALELMQQAYFLAVGMWPAAHPPPAVAEALARPELELARVDFDRDFTRALVVTIRGIDVTR